MVRTAKISILASIRLGNVHLIGLPPLSPAPSRPGLADMLLSCWTAAAASLLDFMNLAYAWQFVGL